MVLFHVEPLRFSFLAKEAISFPEGKSSNILRGAFGLIFRKIACAPLCPGAQACELRAECPYARLFEPRSIGNSGPSGFADQPRPFVFRAMHLDGRTIAAGEPFHFDLHLFDREPLNLAYLTLAFAQLAREGLGPKRSKVDLATVAALDERHLPRSVLYQEGILRSNAEIQPVTIDLLSRPRPVSRIQVRFVTPTELKGAGQPRQPEFGILAARARDRISLLRELYGDGPLAIDFRDFGERARQVTMVQAETRAVDVHRRSSRTGQVHSIGGFMGTVEYAGDLTEFMPYLRAAEWTGVGRQTVWGKGEIVVEDL